MTTATPTTSSTRTSTRTGTRSNGRIDPALEPADPRQVLAIHEQMRIDTRRAAALVAAALPADREGRLRPFATWAVGFGQELHVHHWVEDDHLFPALVARRPDVAPVIDDLGADHEVVADILERWNPAVARLADPRAPFAEARAEMLELTTGLRDLLQRHLAIEDDQIVPVISSAFTEGEMQAIIEPVMRSLPKRSLPFTIPWNVEALPAEMRAEVLAQAPLPLRLIHRATVRRHRRLVAATFDGVAVPALA
jgi:hypothetical protein